MLRLIERERSLSVERYEKVFGLNVRTWARDLKALRLGLAPFGDRIYREGWSLKLAQEDPGGSPYMHAKDIEHLETLCVGQAADLKIDTGTFRVWLNRVNNQVEYERLIKGRWENCND